MEGNINVVVMNMNQKSCDDDEVMDGSDHIMELVGNGKVFGNWKYVDHQLHRVEVLEPAVAHHDDHIYSQIRHWSNFTPITTLGHVEEVQQQQLEKMEYNEVLVSDMILELKRDPVVILRMDGQDLLEFINSPSFEPQMTTIILSSSEMGAKLGNYSIQEHILKAFDKLTVDHGLPPLSDPWVKSNIIEPALQECCGTATATTTTDEKVVINDEESLLLLLMAEMKKVAQRVADYLNEKPVIVAHTEHTFDGTSINSLFSNKVQLDEAIETALKDVPKDGNGEISKEYLRVALIDLLGPSAGLPPLAAVPQMDKIIGEACKMVEGEGGKMVKEEDFKKLVSEVLGYVCFKLENNPIYVSSNSVIHDPHQI